MLKKKDKTNEENDYRVAKFIAEESGHYWHSQIKVKESIEQKAGILLTATLAILAFLIQSLYSIHDVDIKSKVDFIVIFLMSILLITIPLRHFYFVIFKVRYNCPIGAHTKPMIDMYEKDKSRPASQYILKVYEGFDKSQKMLDANNDERVFHLREGVWGLLISAFIGLAFIVLRLIFICS